MGDLVLERAWQQAEHRVEQLMTEREQWRRDRKQAEAELDLLRAEVERLTKPEAIARLRADGGTP